MALIPFVVPAYGVPFTREAACGTRKMMITNNDKGGIRLFDREREDLDMRRATVLHRRYVSDEQIRRFEGYAAEIFEAFGLDLST